jgi:hypothetical protein
MVISSATPAMRSARVPERQRQAHQARRTAPARTASSCRAEEAQLTGAVGDVGVLAVLGRASMRRETNQKKPPIRPVSPPESTSAVVPIGSCAQTP